MIRARKAGEREVKSFYHSLFCPFNALKDMYVAFLAGPVKAIFGIGNSAGFAISQGKVAASGVGLCSPVTLTAFYFNNPEEVSALLVIVSWTGYFLIMYMGWIHSKCTRLHLAFGS